MIRPLSLLPGLLACAGPDKRPVDDTASETGGDTASPPRDSDQDGFVDADDCAPQDPTIWPGALEVCDHLDNDCDALTDEGEVPGSRLCGLWGAIPSTDADAVFSTDTPWADGAGLFNTDAGDVNGDGLDDLLIASELLSDVALYAGGVWLFLGPQVGEHDLAEAQAGWLGEWKEAYLGHTSSGLGDLDGDGLADIGLVASGEEDSEHDRSVLYVVDGPGSGVLDVSEAGHALTIPCEGDGTIYQSVSHAPHLEDQEMSSIVVGVPYLSGWHDPGHTYVVHGPVSAGGELTERADAELIGADDDSAGYAVDGTGDADGDGVSDLLISTTTTGGSYLSLGPLSGTSSLEDADAHILGEGELYPQLFLAFGGDQDGDGTDDLLLSAFAAYSFSGAVAVMSGQSRGTITVASASATISGHLPSEWLGHDLDGIGDQDGDGYDDIAASGTTDDLISTVFVFYGPLSGAQTSADSDAALGGDLPALGQVVGAGDTNGDGFPDLLTGPIWGLDETETIGGGAYLFLGGAR